MAGHLSKARRAAGGRRREKPNDRDGTDNYRRARSLRKELASRQREVRQSRPKRRSAPCGEGATTGAGGGESREKKLNSPHVQIAKFCRNDFGERQK
jgi:hypothetical protein